MSSDSPTAVEKRLGYALKMAQHALRLAMDDALRPLGLTTPQYAVLCAIEAEPGISNASLARAVFVTAQTMQAVLGNLERAGHMDRRAAPDNRRLLRSELTRPGRRTLARAHEAVRVVEDRLVASLGKSNAGAFTTALLKCADDLRSISAAR